MIRSRTDLTGVRRMVVKIGSSLLADAKTGVRQDVIDQLVDELVGYMAQRHTGSHCYIRSRGSGACAAGLVQP